MKKLIAILLTVCMVLPLFPAFPVLAADAPTDGYTFGNETWYYADGTLADAPRTIEAWIWVDPDGVDDIKANGNSTTVISNYNQISTYSYWHMAVKWENNTLYPFFEWRGLIDNVTTDLTRGFNFKNATITPGEWTHISIVVNGEKNYVSCYKNGQHIQNNSGNIRLGDITKNAAELPLVVGNDNRFDTPTKRMFQGKISSISLFNDVRTNAEIQSDYNNGANYNDANALAHWEFTSTSKKVVDKSGKGPDLDLSQYWLTESEMDAIRGEDFDPAYSFAVVGDIQYMTEWDAAKGTSYVSQIYKWIKDNVDTKNIEYVMGMGDVTNTNTDAEWTVAYNAIKQLNGVVPYSTINGNHDLYTGTTGSGSRVPNAEKLGPNAIDNYFGKDDTYMAQFTGDNGGLYEEGSVTNTYYKFTVGTTKWLVINLDFSPAQEILDWANQVVAAHPDYKVIMTTHGYLNVDGTPLSDEDTSGMDTTNGKPNYTNGEEMWTNFASKHENIVMVLSGHMESNNIKMKQAKGEHGNTVTQFLIDQQAIDNVYMEDGVNPLGLVAMFYFSEDGRNVSVEWYSTLYDKYFQTCNQMSFDMEADCEEQIFPWDGRPDAPRGSGTKDDPYIVESGGNLLWMSYQVDAKERVNLTNGGTVAFENTYFKQVCDIDLDGLTTRAIGYYHSSQDAIEIVAGFGGHYDGGGYKIKNGRVIQSVKAVGHGVNINWTDGLFGCIWGATIENVTLDNITIWSRGVTGGIVGRAVAPRNVDAPSDFNTISNCHILDTCRLVSQWQSGMTTSATEYGYNTRYRAGIVGAICGMAYATTIENCSSAVEFNVSGDHTLVGGIAGTAGYNTVIKNCEFTGGITLTSALERVSGSIGGIVGLYSPNLTTETMNPADDYLGTLTINNCKNSGYFNYAVDSDLPSGLELHFGGILGHAPDLGNDNDLGITILNCENTYVKTKETVLANNTNYMIGEIIGKNTAGVTPIVTDSTYVGVQKNDEADIRFAATLKGDYRDYEAIGFEFVDGDNVGEVSCKYVYSSLLAGGEKVYPSANGGDWFFCYTIEDFPVGEYDEFTVRCWTQKSGEEKKYGDSCTYSFTVESNGTIVITPLS